MKKISTLGLTILLTLFFIGCGSDSANNNSETTVVTCFTNDVSTNSTWTTVNSGNTITVTTGTELLWKQTTIKQVCIKSGTGNAAIN